MGSVLAADEALFQWVAGWPHGPVLDTVMLYASLVGDHGVIWLALASVCGLLWRGPYAMAAWRLALAVGLSAVLVDNALKPLLARARPFDTIAHSVVLGARPITPSFPSGHTATAVAGALALGFVWRRPRALWWALAALIAVSRVYVGVHYPLDIGVGGLMGWATARFATASTPSVPV